MLSNKVSEIMTTHLTTAPASASVFDVMRTMEAEDVGRIIVTDEDIPIGIFTEKDVLRRVVNAGIDARKSAIRSVMTTPVRAVREETHIIEAFGKMYRGKYRHLSRARPARQDHRHRLHAAHSQYRRRARPGTERNDQRWGISRRGRLSRSMTKPAYSKPSRIMDKKNVTAVIVMAGKPAGIFTERDVLKRVAIKEIPPEETRITQVMTAPIITMPRTTLVGDVLAEMYRRDIRNMPVRAEAGN